MSEALAQHLPVIAIGVLLFAAAAAFLTSFRVARWIALVTSVAQLLFAGWLAASVMQSGPVVYSIGGWGAPLGIDLYVDGLSALMILLTAIVGFVVTLYSAGYFEPKEKYRLFWPLWLFLWASLVALFSSNDIFNLYVCLELLSISAVALVALAGTRTALFASMRYLLSALAGSLIYLFGVAMVYGSTGVLSINLLSEYSGVDPATQVGLALMVVGLLIKTALFPMHFWLPPAHANAVAPVSAVLSALVIKGSFYIILRIVFTLPTEDLIPALPTLLGVLGVAAIAWGSVMAFMQKRLKMMVAYSTVAQIGYLFLMFPLVFSALDVEGSTLAINAGVFHALSHGLAKGAMFLSAGAVVASFGHDNIERLSGLSRVAPVQALTFGVAGVSMLGLPPSGGFVSKWLYVSAALDTGQWWWAAVVMVGGLMAAAYVFKAVGVFMREPQGIKVETALPLSTSWAPLSLALISLFLGVFGQPALDLLAPAAQALSEGILS